MNIPVYIRRRFGLVATVIACAVSAPVLASESVHLDKFPTEKMQSMPALQDGARTFVNYCLNCHSASMMRFNRLQDIGLTDEQISGSLQFTEGRVGDLMKVAMRHEDGKAWFGAAPPDLSVEARARASESGSGADWIYTYLRSYYRDGSRETGWNNAVFPNVGMPNPLWQWQGMRGAVEERVAPVTDEATGKVTGWTKTTITYDREGNKSEKVEKVDGDGLHEGTHFTLGTPEGGTLSQAEFDDKVANLVAFMKFMSDPSAPTRGRLGIWVLLFIALFVGCTWWLNREYWKDIK